MRLGEWKIGPWLSGLGEGAGYRVFAVLHVPLYPLLLLVLIGGRSTAPIIGLHVVFSNHPENLMLAL